MVDLAVAADVLVHARVLVPEVAELVVKVAEAPEYLTGQVITIDGAWI